MTEEEAKTKWCPHSRFKFSALSDCAARNREPDTDGQENLFLRRGTRCIGAGCMAWRLGADAWRRPNGTVIKTDREPHDGQGCWVKTGFCGLAGAPQ